MGKMIRTAVLTTAVFLSVVTPTNSWAHEESALHALSVLERVTPDLPGVSFRVVQITQPVLVARNRTDDPLVILGREGEPFLRLWHGRVETNLGSPLSYMAADPTGRHAVVPSDVRTDRAPVWRVIGRRDSWSWFDPRIRFSSPRRHAWLVPARLGTREIAINGSFESLEGHGHFRTELGGVSPPEDLEIRLLQGLVPALYVRNDTGDLLEVRGRHGEPFLRIGPDGVTVNERSPDYWLGGTGTVQQVPAGADPSAPPKWHRLSMIPIWSWLEFRARLPIDLHQRALLGDQRKTVLTWTSPMTLAGEPLDVGGRVEWIPPRVDGEAGPLKVWNYVGGAVAAVAVVIAAWLLRRRSARAARS